MSYVYSIRDRLLDYYMRPFIGPDDKAVMSAVADSINNPKGGISAISETPHHFEVWVLAKIHEDGNIAPGKTLICDCSSLVRPSVRGDKGSQSGEGTRQSASNGRTDPIGTPAGPTRAKAGAPPTEAQSAPGAHGQVRPGPGGVPGHGTDGVTA